MKSVHLLRALAVVAGLTSSAFLFWLGGSVTVFAQHNAAKEPLRDDDALAAATCSMRLHNFETRQGRVQFRYNLGGVPATSATSESHIAIVFYTRENRKAFLVLYVKDEHGKLRALRDNYSLRGIGARWEVDSEISGNGGIGTYEHMARFVENLAKLPSHEILLSTPPDARCGQDY